jgi:pimeloyl-ACP methyl ester carboxylesterase
MRNAILLFLSALLLFAGGSAWIALYPTIPDDLGGVENFDDKAQRVRIPVGGTDHLDGWFLPGRLDGTVILFAGYARDHRRVWRYGRFLHEQGLNVLTVDFRSARRVDRKPTTLGHWELEDARATLDWLRRQPALGARPVALFGESLGGAVALALAAERPDVAAVVADCPFASSDAAIEDGFQFVVRLPAYPLAPIARQMGRALTGQDPGAFDATAALRALNGRPVLVIQTKLEDRFSRAQVQRISAALGLRGEQWTLEDVKHTETWLRHRSEYEKRVGGFFAAHLGVRAGRSSGTASAAATVRTTSGSRPAPAAATSVVAGAGGSR